ncbi:MAG: hypothetical protein KDA89_12345, partial [Planctomycetaceae bacterium]|nr:hypothetical protein [Planctomycetaceae bacterium]
EANNWSNDGLLEATTGGNLDLNRNWVSGGIIRAERSTVFMDGTFSLGGTIALDRGAIQSNSVIEIRSGRLIGTGTVHSELRNDGTITPGTDFGTLTLSQNYTQTAGGNLAIDVESSANFDAVSVTGSVSLAGDLFIGIESATTLPVGAELRIIDNDGADPINGQFFELAEGQVFIVSEYTFEITYLGGTGNDVVLTYLGQKDITAPASRVQPLPTAAASLSIDITVSGSDPAGAADEAISGMDHIDIFVAEDTGDFLYWTTVPANSATAEFVAHSGHTYWFRSLAVDTAGNIEQKVLQPDTHIYVGDFDSPATRVTSAIADSATGLFAVSLEGSDTGGAGLAMFDVYVSVDSEPPQRISSLPAGVPDDSGTYTASFHHQGLVDGSEHSYVFYSIGRDDSENVESAPAAATDDVMVTATFAVPLGLVATDLEIQRGSVQRSYIRHIDLTFSGTDGLQALVQENRIRIERFDLAETDVTPGTGEAVDLSAVVWTVSGNRIQLDFGAAGIGGNRNSGAGDGFYRILMDLDGDGLSDDGYLEFFRMFGDADGNGTVNNADIALVNRNYGRLGIGLDADLNGDGTVNILDRIFTYREAQLGKLLASDLFDLLDD